MLVKFNSKNATVYDKDRDAMEKKLSQRLSRYFADDDIEALVKISEEKIGFKAEITLPYYGYQMRAEATSKDGLFAAFDNALDVIERRMAKHKDKIVSKKQKVVAADVSAADVLDDDEKVVRVKRYEMKPMTTADAILNMELLGHDFYVFMSSEENKYCTLYKRKDGGYGLVVPA